MDKEIEYRVSKSGDEKGIIDLLVMAFPFWEKLKSPLDFWKWKFMDSPQGSIIRVAKDEDKVVGCGHAVVLNVKIGGDTLIGTMGADVATHPNYRGRGVYKQIHAMSEKLRAERGIKLNYSESWNPFILKVTHTKEHVVFPKEISYMVRIRDVGLHLKNRPVKYPQLTGLGYRALRLTNKARNALKKAPLKGN